MNTNKNTKIENENITTASVDETTSKKAKSKSTKVKWFTITPAIALIVALATVAWSFANYPGQEPTIADACSSEEVVQEPTDKSAAYVTDDGMLYYYDAESDKSVFITDSALAVPEYDHYDYNYIHITEDNRNAYYMKDFKNACDFKSGTLCIRSLENPNEQPVTIDTDVKNYVVVKDHEKLVYSKQEEALQLYEYDILTGTKTLVCKSETCYIQFELADANKYYYICDDKFYEKTFGQESKYITDEITSFMVNEKNGYVSLSKYEKDNLKIKLSDYIEYDVSKDDFANDELWNTLETEFYDRYCGTPWFYDGTDLIKLADCGYILSYDDIISYCTVTYDQSEKIKVSEINYLFDVYNHIDNRIYCTFYIYENGVSREICKEKCNDRSILTNKDNTEIVFIDHYNYSLTNPFNEGDLYRISLTGECNGTPEFIAAGVYEAYYVDNSLVYATNLDYTTFAGDYYVDGNLYCENASEFHYSNGKSAYMANYEYDRTIYRGSGVFTTQTGGKTEPICEELVTTPIIFNDGSVAYSLFDEETLTSQLYLYANGKSECLESEYSQFSYCGYMENADALYYVKDSNLYFVCDGETKLVAEGVHHVSAKTLYR